MGLLFLSTILIYSRDLPIMDTLRPNIHFGSTLRLRSTTQKSCNRFKAGVWQYGELSQEACTTDLVLDSWFDCPAWQSLESRSESSSSKEFKSTTLGSICAPGSTVVLRELTIWGAHWTTAGYPEPIESTKDSYTCYGISEEWVEARPLKAAAATVFEFGAASLVVTRSPLLFIVEANVISSLSGRLSSFARYLELGGKYHSMCAHTFCIILSSQPTSPEKAKSHQRIFHEEGHAWFYSE